MAEIKKFWNVAQNVAGEAAEVWIYDIIGEGMWFEGVAAKEFCKDIAALNVKKLDVRINSPGGSVPDGIAIYNALRRHPANVTTYIDAEAASIASVIALAGDKCVMAENAVFMIHDPWSCCQGSAEDMRKEAAVLDVFKGMIVTAYVDKTGMSADEISTMMTDETWMDAATAKAFGFIDAIGTESKIQACKFDHKSLGYKNAVEADQPDEDEEDCTQDSIKDSALAENITAPKAEKVEVVMDATVAAPVAGATRDYAAEVKEISALCAAHGHSDKIADFVGSGKTPNEVAREILALNQSKPLPSAPVEKELSQKYSYKNAIAAALAMAEGKKVSSFEADISQDIAKSMPLNYASKGGIFIPMNTNLTSGGTLTGAELLRTQYGDLIELLRAMSVTNRMGAQYLTGLTGPLSFPKQTGSATLSWVGENPGSDVTQSNITTAMVTLAPKTAMATETLSRQLIVQSTPNAEQLVRNDLAIIAALGIDRAALHGTGDNNQPDGLYHLANVNYIAMGGTPTFGKMVDMQTAVANYNALLGNLGYVMTPGMAGKLRQSLVTSVAGSAMIYTGSNTEGQVAGYNAMASNQVSSTLGSGQTPSEHGIIFGNWNDLIIGQWGGIEITVDPYTQAKKGNIEITMHLMVDVIARHPQSFCKATGATI